MKTNVLPLMRMMYRFLKVENEDAWMKVLFHCAVSCGSDNDKGEWLWLVVMVYWWWWRGVGGVSFVRWGGMCCNFKMGNHIVESKRFFIYLFYGF